MNITILGAGAYGLALSKMFSLNKCSIKVWTKLDKEYDMLVKERCNKFVLPDYIANDDVSFYNNMEEAVMHSNIIVIAVPVKFVRSTIVELKKYYRKSMHICIASKGIEQDSLLFISNIVKKYIKTKKIAVISGGTFAVDMISDVPLALSLASKNKQTILIIKKSLQNRYLKLIPTSDVFGVEMYGAIKNVIAIASGIVDGLNYPESTKSMFITKSLNDVMNMIYYFGGNKKTILTYAGIGDLLLTCTSSKSRNYTLGRMYGEGKSNEEILKYINNTTIEGLYTLKSIYNLTHKKNKRSLIIDTIYNIIYKNESTSKLEEYLIK